MLPFLWKAIGATATKAPFTETLGPLFFQGNEDDICKGCGWPFVIHNALLVLSQSILPSAAPLPPSQPPPPPSFPVFHLLLLPPSLRITYTSACRPTGFSQRHSKHEHTCSVSLPDSAGERLPLIPQFISSHCFHNTICMKHRIR